jgi:hypothetical protein
MFFYIGDNCDILNKADTKLFLDEGWDHPTEDIWIKGYSTECVLSNVINEIIKNNYQPRGIWAVIQKVNNEYKIFNSVEQGFPIFNNGDSITNFKLIESIPKIYTKINDILKNEKLDTKEEYSLEVGSQKILDILKENITNILLYNKCEPIMLYTGGIDSLTIWAILDSITDSYKLEFPLDVENIKISSAKPAEGKLIDHLKKYHWGYKISEDYSKKEFIMSGFYGDEYLLRNPNYQTAVIANVLGLNLQDIIQPTHYMYHYVTKKGPYSYTEISREEAMLNIFNGILGDNQHWHYNNNIYFSPFLDHRIFKIACKMYTTDLLEHGLEATIQKKIIDLCNPEFNKLLDDKKNKRPGLVNLKNNWHTMPLLKRYNPEWI